MNPINSTEIQAKLKGTLPELLGFEVRAIDEHGLTASFSGIVFFRALDLIPQGLQGPKPYLTLL